MSQSIKYKVPPHNLEAESATLGALLLDWEVSYNKFMAVAR
jgi:replicative DNA helicase